MAQRAGPERLEALIELGADAAHLGLGDPGLEAERGDEVVDLAGAHAMHVGLHHHREQRPVDPAPPLQHRGEERPAAQLRDPQLDVARFGRQQPRPSAVALVRARLGALVQAGADHLRRLGVDQRLEHHLDARTDHVHIATGTDRRRANR